MEIKYSKKKEELRRDPILESIGKARNFLVEHSNAVISTVTVALFVVAAALGYVSLRRASEAKSIEAFGKAMVAYESGDGAAAVEALSSVADKHRSSPQAAYSAFLLGHIYLQRGNVDEAMSWLTIASSHANDGFVAGEAMEGQGICCEMKGDDSRALDFYAKALRSKDVSFRSPDLRWRSALLCKKIGRVDDSRKYLREIAGDTLAAEYRQKAENMLAEMNSL